jgi:alginate O-acetyltransferase complex protein AlgI
MRDKDYERTPPANTYRVALLGASSVMGWGVGDGETFEALLEDRFNKQNGNLPYAKYEILNFGVPGYQPPQQLVALDRALSFAPNAVFYVATGREVARASSYMVEVVQKKIEIPYEPLRELVNRAGLEPSMADATALKQLAPFRSELLSWIYQRIADRARSAGAFPLFIFLPQVREESGQEETAEILRAADAAGFVVINLAGVFKGEDSAALRIAEWDQHPNRLGHQLVASRLYDELQKMQPNVFNARDRTPTN